MKEAALPVAQTTSPPSEGFLLSGLRLSFVGVAHGERRSGLVGSGAGRR